MFYVIRRKSFRLPLLPLCSSSGRNSGPLISLLSTGLLHNPADKGLERLGESGAQVRTGLQ